MPVSKQFRLSRQGCAMREFPGTSKEEGGTREVLQVQTELTRLSAEVVEEEQRLAILRGGCVFWWNNCRRQRKMTVPKPTCTKRVCRQEDFVPQCDEEMQE